VETARSIDAPLKVCDDLREISLGEWDGLSWADIETRYPEQAVRKAADWTCVTPPGGEPWDVFSRRVLRAVAQISSGPLPAAVIGHVAVNSVIAESLAGIDALAFVQEYCEVLEIELNDATVESLCKNES
jgi:broad specificity phosphatase PhoE